MNLETKRNYAQLTWIFIAASICYTINHGYSFAMTVPAESLAHNVSVVLHAANKIDGEKKCTPTEAVTKTELKLPKPSLSNSLLAKNYNDDIAILSGRIVDENCKPISRALITIFQIDSKEVRPNQKSIWQINTVSKFELEEETPVDIDEYSNETKPIDTRRNNMPLDNNSISQQNQLNSTSYDSFRPKRTINKKHHQRFGRRTSSRINRGENINCRADRKLGPTHNTGNSEEKNIAKQSEHNISGPKYQISQVLSIAEEEDKKSTDALETKKVESDQLSSDKEEKKSAVRSRTLMRTTARVIKLQSRESKFQSGSLFNNDIDGDPSPHSISNRIADRTNQIMSYNGKSSLLNSVMRTNLQSLRNSFGKQMLSKKKDPQYNTQETLLNEEISNDNSQPENKKIIKDTEAKNATFKKWQTISPKYLSNPDTILPRQRWKRYEYENEPQMSKQSTTFTHNEDEFTVIKESSTFVKNPTSNKKSQKRRAIKKKKRNRDTNYGKIHNTDKKQIIIESDIGIEGETLDDDRIEQIDSHSDLQEKNLEMEDSNLRTKATQSTDAKQKKCKNKARKRQTKKTKRIKRKLVNSNGNAVNEEGTSILANEKNSQDERKLIVNNQAKEEMETIPESLYSSVASTSIASNNGTFNFMIPQSPYIKMYLIKIQRAKRPNIYYKFLVVNSSAKSDFERVNAYSQKWLNGNPSEKANLIVVGNSTSGYKFSIVVPNS